MSNEEQELAEIVQQAYSIDESDQRDKFLDQSCKRRPGLKTRLQMIVDAIPDSPSEAAPPQGSPRHTSEHSVLKAISAASGISQQANSVVLDDSIDQSNEPIVQPTSPEMPKTIDSSRYQLQGEIARGGMGAVLKGRDIDLGRNLAVKVLLDAHKDNPLAVQRFIEEAQIGGQLQHPGVAPVYELGQFEDRRPFFTMKLVKGDTLALMLASRYSVQHNRAKLLGIFEQVCQTMAYAHSRGVIHRDLKPANIMAGAFGEVQVMDWGLAKVLPAGGQQTASKPSAPDDGKSVIATVRSPDGSGPVPVFRSSSNGDPQNDVGSQTQMGRALGTPAYMAPEQAMGDVDRMDRRTDVFGLGAILCEILTGQPIYVADDLQTLMRMACRGKTNESIRLLDACGADDQLVELTKHCLQFKQSDRPSDAGEVSRRISRYLESVEEQVHEKEIQIAEETARAGEERKRRKAVLALSAGILGLLLLGGGGWKWNQNQLAAQREALVEDFDESVGRAKLRLQRASTENLTERYDHLERGLESVREAIQLAKSPQLRRNSLREAEELEKKLDRDLKATQVALDQQNQNTQLQQRLAFIRTSHAESNGTVNFANFDTAFAFESVNERYLKAFRDAGIDVKDGDIKRVSTQIRESEIQSSLISAMDHWIAAIPKYSKRDRVRANFSAGRWETAAKIAQQRVQENSRDTVAYLELAPALILSGQTTQYRELCRQMRDQFLASKTTTDSGRTTKVCLLLDNAIELREIPSAVHEAALDDGRVPKVILGFGWGTRAMLQYRRGRLKEAAECCVHAEAAEMNTRAEMYLLACKTLIQHGLGSTDQAKQSLARLRELIHEALGDDTLRGNLDTAIALVHFREAESKLGETRPDPRIKRFIENGNSQFDLPKPLVHQSTKERLLKIVQIADESSFRKGVREAVAAEDFDKLLSLAKDADAQRQSPELMVSLGSALREAGHVDEANSVLQSASLRVPNDFWVHYELAKCMRADKQYSEALNYARAAFALRPESLASQILLASSLSQAGQNEDSLAILQEVIADDSMTSDDLVAVGKNLYAKGFFKQARLAFARAVEKESEDADTSFLFSNTLFRLNELDESLRVAQQTLRLDSENLLGLLTVGAIYLSRKDLEQALVYFDRAVKAHPANPVAHRHRARALLTLGRMEEAKQALRRAIQIDPRSIHARSDLQKLLQQQPTSTKERDSGGGVDQFVKAKPVTAHEWIEYYETLVSRNASNDQARIKLLPYYRTVNQYDKVLEHSAELLRRDPESMLAWFNQGIAQTKQGQLDSAIESLRTAIRLEPEFPGARFRLAIAFEKKLASDGKGQLTETERAETLDEVVQCYRAAIQLGAGQGPSRQALIDALRRRGDEQEASELEAEFDSLPDGEAMKKLMQEVRWHFGEGNDADAQRGLQQFLKRFPNHKAALMLLVATYVRSGMYDASLRECRKLVSVQPDSLVIKQTFGETLILNQQFDEGLKILRDVYAQDPGTAPNPRAAIALALYEKGEQDEAMTWCRNGLRNSPGDRLLRAAFAFLLAFPSERQGEESRLGEALRHAEIAYNAKKLNTPFEAIIAHASGLVYYRLGRWQESVDRFQEAYRLNHFQFDGYFLAMAYRNLGDTEKANHWYKRSEAEYAKYEKLLPSQKAIAKEAHSIFESEK
ncbi:MAG: tetratricopeptide repeat protein [Planctomycetota bacterium]